MSDQWLEMLSAGLELPKKAYEQIGFARVVANTLKKRREGLSSRDQRKEVRIIYLIGEECSL